MLPIDERTAMLALVLRSGAERSAIREAVMDAGSARTVLQRQAAGEDTLFPQTIDELSEVEHARAIVTEGGLRGSRLFCFLDEEYPEQLREIHEMPLLVWTRGRSAHDRRAIAVVGSRSASHRGISAASEIAANLAKEHVTVVSGLASGIDTAAHTAALEAGGRTVAVLGTGINRTYPPQNHELQETIADRGMVLSQFLPDSAPTRQSFPMRNAVMSGYAAATVVVEAGEHSGARIQARMALEHGRPLILLGRLVETTGWASGFAGRPGVYVVTHMDELLNVVNERISEAETSADQLARAAEVDW
ncbi:DNA-processing protein DprA [Streptomonospora arabica]|uniref:DNA-processing protein DprA n=1 Tax=Streptomonospora arabica TaxID=412417 RepID=A0ABV9SR92_9ACTN